MSGLLFLFILVVWAALMVPTYLRRHDYRTLERQFETPLTEQLRERWATRPQHTPQQRAFHRRRRVLMTLLTSLVITSLFAAAGRIATYWLLVPLGLTAVFIAAAVSAVNQQTATVHRPVQRPAARPVVTPTYHHTTVSVPVAAPANPHAWKPNPMPLPSYLTADRAGSAARTWTAQDMLAQAEVIRAERSQRIREAQDRFESARAAAMERARLASLAADQTIASYRDQRASGDW